MNYLLIIGGNQKLRPLTFLSLLTDTNTLMIVVQYTARI